MNTATKASSETKVVSPRMFRSDFLEYFSHVNPYTPVVIYVPVILFFLHRSAVMPGLAWWLTIVLCLAGILTWSFLEYVLHRYVFHWQNDTDWGKRLHFFLHGVHHDYPQDMTRLVMPPGFSIPLAVLFYFAYKAIFGEVYTPALYAGLVTGYLIYDMTHFAIHRFNFNAKWWKKIKQHHMKHHFMDSDNGFGVSSMLWDYVFQTHKFQPKNKK